MNEGLLLRDERAIWHPFTPNPHFGPKVVIDRAQGAYLFDVDGKRYFDATSSWWCQIHGHCHPRLVAALQRQSERLDQMLFSPHTHTVAIELSEALLGVTGSHFSKVFFSDNGSTAVETALKIGIQYWRNLGESRSSFVSIGGAYHGDTLGAVALGQSNVFHSGLPSQGIEVFQTVMPYCYRCPLDKSYPACEIACVTSLDSILEEHSKKIAAIVVEPLVLGASGMIVYPKEYLERICERAKEFGIPLVFDEVFTGFGRTGSMFVTDTLKIKPDILCLSKGLTSGMLPLGATLVTDKIHETFQTREKTLYHGHTFTANALSSTVALESLKVFEEERVLDRNETLSKVLSDQKPRFEDHKRIGAVRHLGMIWAIELVRNRDTKNPEILHNLWNVSGALWDKGYWLRPLHNMLYLVPPYCSTPDELVQLCDDLYEEISNESHFTDGAN